MSDKNVKVSEKNVKATKESTSRRYDPAKLGRGAETTELLEFDGTEFPNKAARYHSELAMEAARKMRRTRQKKKTGQEVCHHLKMMLTAEPPKASYSPAEGQFKLAI